MSTTNPTEITTQWEDQMVKRGIWAPKETVKTNEELYNERIEALESVNMFDNAKLDKLEDIRIDGDEDFEIELKAIREKRLALLKNKVRENSKYGQLYHITKQDFVREVTDCSKNVTVVVHLFKDSILECQLINSILNDYISKKYGNIKFVKGISSDIIPNYPDKSLPLLIIYRNGKTLTQISGMCNFKDDNKCITNKSIEKLLLKNKIIGSDKVNGGEYSDDSDNYSDRDNETKEYGDNKCYSSLKFDKIQERIKYLHKI